MPFGTDYLINTAFSDGNKAKVSSIDGTWKGFFQKKAGGTSYLEGLIQADDGNIVTDCDPFNHNLMRFYSPIKFRSPLSEVIAQGSSVRYLGQIKYKNTVLERIEVSHSRAVLTIDFDPEVNYLARKVASKSKLGGGNNQPVLVQEVIEFVETVPGVFFPSKVICVNPENGDQAWGMEFKEIQVNQSVEKDKLEFHFPARLLVMDRIRNGAFLTDSYGNPCLPGKNAKGELIALAEGIDPSIHPNNSSESTRASDSEEKSLSRWILPVVVGFIGVGLLAGLVKKYRR